MSKNGWTEERKAKQSELIRQWQPWSQSTGPRTEQGKKHSSHNAYKGGHRKQARDTARYYNALLKDYQSVLEGFISNMDEK